MSRPLSIAFLAFAALAGCTGLSKEQRIENKLEEAGLKPSLARCMAGKLARDLGDDELRTLADAVRAPAADGGKPGRKALIRRIDALGDPHVSDVVARAGIGCAVLG